MVSATARRSILVGAACAAWAAKRIFFKDFRKNFVLSSAFSDDFLQQNNYAATMTSGGGAHKLSASRRGRRTALQTSRPTAV